MHHLTLPDATRAAVVRTHLMAQAADALVIDGFRRRAERLSDDETGAQAAEYAMLGGVSAAACSALIALFKNKETVGRVVDAVLGALAQVIGGWF